MNTESTDQTETKPEEKPLSETRQKLAAMLKENTGRHFLDSGGAYGRHWERNQARDFEKELETVLAINKWGEIEVTHNVYHWLANRLEFDKEGSRFFDVVDRYMRAKNWRDGKTGGRRLEQVDGHYTWLPAVNGAEPYWAEVRDAFPEMFAKWKTQKQAERVCCEDCDGDGWTWRDEHTDVKVTCEACRGRGWVRDEVQPLEAVGIYGEGGPTIINTYNEENFLSQTIQFTYFQLREERARAYDAEYVLLEIHGGCDVRGGYTKPQLFRCESTMGGELEMFDFNKATIYCTSDGPYVTPEQLEWKEATKHTYDDAQHYWCGDGSSFGYQGGWGAGLTALEDYKVVTIDPEEWERLSQECGLGDNVLENDDAKPMLFAKTWVRGYLCRTPDNKGYCPHCGGELGASPL